MSLNYGSVEVMITLHPRVVKIDWGSLKRNMKQLGVVEKSPEHCMVNCIMLFAKTGYNYGVKNFYVLRLPGQVVKKLAVMKRDP